MPADARWVRVAGADEIPVGGGKVVRAGRLDVALFNVEGTFHALTNQCPHVGGPLGEGRLEGTVIECPWHCWGFDVTTGRCTTFEGAEAARYEVRLEGAEVQVRVP